MVTKEDIAAQVKDVSTVVPPPIQRKRESSVPQAVIEAMADGINKAWRTNGETYKTKSLAGNAAALFRRRLLAFLQIDGKQLKSRVWDLSEQNNPEDGQWVFALTKREPK